MPPSLIAPARGHESRISVVHPDVTDVANLLNHGSVRGSCVAPTRGQVVRAPVPLAAPACYHRREASHGRAGGGSRLAKPGRGPDGPPRTERAVRLAAALVLLATVLAISTAVLLTDISRSVIVWTATGALLFLAIIFIQRR